MPRARFRFRLPFRGRDDSLSCRARFGPTRLDKLLEPPNERVRDFHTRSHCGLIQPRRKGLHLVSREQAGQPLAALRASAMR